jgi:hypothetical protein
MVYLTNSSPEPNSSNPQIDRGEAHPVNSANKEKCVFINFIGIYL